MTFFLHHPLKYYHVTLVDNGKYYFIDIEDLMILNSLEGFQGIYDESYNQSYKANDLLTSSILGKPEYLGFDTQDNAILAKLVL